MKYFYILDSCRHLLTYFKFKILRAWSHASSFYLIIGGEFLSKFSNFLYKSYLKNQGLQPRSQFWNLLIDANLISSK